MIENTQRDLNIAFVNELSIIFEKLGLDTVEVLKAAGTKWNFLPFRPGLVGGHCIGVDPYYLTHKAELAGYHPRGDPRRAAHQRRHGQPHRAQGRAADDPRRAQHQGRARQRARAHLQGGRARHPQLQGDRHRRASCASSASRRIVHDPLASAEDALHEYGVKLRSWDELPAADALILAVSHKRFLETPVQEYLKKIVRGGCVIDVKSVLDAAGVPPRGAAGLAPVGVGEQGLARTLVPQAPRLRVGRLRRRASAAALGRRGVRQGRALRLRRDRSRRHQRGFRTANRHGSQERTAASTSGRSAPTAASRWTSWPRSRRAGRSRHRSATCSSSTSTSRSRSAGSTRRRSTAWRGSACGASRSTARPRSPPASRSRLRRWRCASHPARCRASPTSPGRAPTRSRCRATAPRLLQKTAQFPLRALREAQRSGREWLEQRPLASRSSRDRPRFPRLPKREEIVVCP